MNYYTILYNNCGGKIIFIFTIISTTYMEVK